MSALRVSVPGQPVRLIDLGPDAGRIRHTRGAVYGGVMVVAPNPKSIPTPVERAAARRRQENTWPRCGAWMPKANEVCGRRSGHRDDHKSARGMREIAERRWSR